jgi:hypothetical protein
MADVNAIFAKLSTIGATVDLLAARGLRAARPTDDDEETLAQLFARLVRNQLKRRVDGATHAQVQRQAGELKAACAKMTDTLGDLVPLVEEAWHAVKRPVHLRLAREEENEVAQLLQARLDYEDSLWR